MKRNHIGALLGAVLVVAILGSCDAMFTNQFQTWRLGQVNQDTLLAAANSGDVATLIAESGLTSGEGVSPSFLAAATSNAETANEIKTVLQDTVDDPAATPEEKQAAEVLLIEIELEMNGGNDLIDNIVVAIGGIDFKNFNIGNPSDLANLLSSLFPAKGIRALPSGWTVDQVAAVLDGIAASQDRFAELVQFMGDSGYSIPGIDAGRLAQVGTIANILSRVGFVSPAYTSIGDALANLINDVTDSLDPEHFPFELYIQVPPSLIDDMKADTGLQELFTAAGLDLVALLNTFGA